jgi:broad specificity phosphatase PhoE
VGLWTFVRHGESVANVENWFAGQIDAPLTDAGRVQARTLADVLRPTHFDRVFVSDLSRARDTAAAIVDGRGLELVVTPHLRERHCGDLEGVPVDELERSGRLRTFRDFDGRPPGGESLRDVAMRVLGFLAGVDDDDRALVVAHGAVMRATIGVLDATAPDRIGHWWIGNCEVVERTLPVGTFAAKLRELERTH